MNATYPKLAINAIKMILIEISDGHA